MSENIFYINLRKNQPENISNSIAKLADCFTAGYTLPQFCIDNKIKKPLFAAYDKTYQDFLWEVYAQFKIDRRLSAEFSFIKGKNESVNHSFFGILESMEIKNFLKMNTESFDKIFLLINNGTNMEDEKIIYLDELVEKFALRAYCEIPILNFLQRFPNVKLILTNTPLLYKNKYWSEFEKQLTPDVVRQFEKISPDEIVEVYNPLESFGYTKQEAYRLLNISQETMIRSDGSTILKDNDDPFIKIQNGKRVTTNQPTQFKNTIYFLGICKILGIGAPVEKTIESYLQRMLNDNNIPYKVENYGQFFFSRYQDIFYNLNNLSLKSGDIVLLNLPALKSNFVPFFDVGDLFNRPHDYGEVFIDRESHLNENGYKALAEKYFDLLTQNNFFQDTEFEYPKPPPPPHRYGIPQENSFDVSQVVPIDELEEYKKKLREKRVPIGAIVMNANPFTLGHEYLVEYASSRVYKLYVFVTEEDKSEFKFADRFKLVQAGVKKFSNVEVLPSGQFIASMQTLSGYFSRNKIQNVKFDTSTDVEVFAREIAPSLGITIRFVGEECYDKFTAQYNESMRTILPQHGIEFCEIPRKEVDGEWISAKTVRAALKEKNFDKLKKFVPKTTLKFLRENFSEK